MKRHLQLLIKYLAQYSKVRLAYKADFFIALITSMTATILGFGFMLVLFTKIPTLKGWDFYEVLFLYGFSLIPLGFFNILSWNLYDFSNLYIIQGRFDRVLLRPVDSLFQILFEKFRIESLQEVFTGAIVLWICSEKLNLEWNTLKIALFLIMVISATIIYISVFLILTAVSFWFEDRIGIVPPVFNMLTFGRYPLTIYNSFIQFVLSWIIPFAFATFYPTTHFLGRDEFLAHSQIVPLVGGFFFVMALVVLNRGVRNYTSTGS